MISFHYFSINTSNLLLQIHKHNKPALLTTSIFLTMVSYIFLLAALLPMLRFAVAIEGIPDLPPTSGVPSSSPDSVHCGTTKDATASDCETLLTTDSIWDAGKFRHIFKRDGQVDRLFTLGFSFQHWKRM